MEDGKISWIIDTSRSLMGFFRKLRTTLKSLRLKGRNSVNANITWKKSVDACVNPIAVTTDEPGSAQPPAYKFRTGTFLVIIDSIDGELQKRLVAHTGIAKRFGFLQKLKDLPDDQVVTSTQSLQ